MQRNYSHCEDAYFTRFMQEQLLWRKIISVVKIDEQTAELTLDNGVVLITRGNEGCGGCGNGWYYLTNLSECDNAITKVEFVNDNEEKYSIFVLAEDKRLNILTYEGHDNGYYGVGFTVEVTRKEK